MHKCIINDAAILFLLLTLVGCTSSGVVKNASPVSTSTPVPLDFVLVETSTSLDNLETEKQLLNDMIITGLRETQVFGSVSGDKADAGSGGGIKVYADIKEIKKVSRSARVWVGALAGRRLAARERIDRRDAALLEVLVGLWLLLFLVAAHLTLGHGELPWRPLNGFGATHE